MSDHDARVAAEIETYRQQLNIHELPQIFHYWSGKYLAPHVAEVFGRDNLYDVFADELRASITASGGIPYILSVGSGDASIEIQVAKRLQNAGFNGFRFHCVELNPHLSERAEASAVREGLREHFEFEVADLSAWRASRTYGGAFAHHSLHHIEALEHVFDQVRDHLADHASFVTADMIGRNGHMRWPETLAIIDEIWSQMPARYKFHHLWGRAVDPYDNWDCSGEGFEGIRAQDIMPCLTHRFHFHKLCVWGGLLDPFIDRGYGHNLDPANPEDLAFIDRLWERETALLRAGAITPTVMVATMQKRPGNLVSSFGLAPGQCIRWP